MYAPLPGNDNLKCPALSVGKPFTKELSLFSKTALAAGSPEEESESTTVPLTTRCACASMLQANIKTSKMPAKYILLCKLLPKSRIIAII